MSTLSATERSPEGPVYWPEWKSRDRRTVSAPLFVQRVTRNELSAEFIDQWRDLESRSCYSNAFLTADFLIPAWTFLNDTEGHFFITVREQKSGKLMALGVFEERSASEFHPLPHLQAARTMHSARTGILVDQEFADEALEALLKFIRDEGWHGFVLPKMRLDSLLARRLKAVGERLDCSWHPRDLVESAAVFPPILDESNVLSGFSHARRKSLRRSRAWLESIGPLRLEHITDRAQLSDAIMKFLDLENQGWKGKAGTSMLSPPADTLVLGKLRTETIADSFFLGNYPAESLFLEEMCTQMFQAGRLVLTQLKVGDQIAATAINFIHGTTLFAFKIGWNPEFSKGSPGMIHEYDLMFAATRQFPQLTCIDSCARPDSYITSIWPHEIHVGTVVMGLSRIGNSALSLIEKLRSIRNFFRRMTKNDASD